MAEVSENRSYKSVPLSMGRSYSERNTRRGNNAPTQTKRRNSEAYERRNKTQRPKWNPTRMFGGRKKKKEQTLVRRRVLEGGFWTRFARKFIKDEVPVECLGELGVTASLLYAKDIPDTTDYYAVTNQIYEAPSKSATDLVCQGDSFEIRVVGMQVAKWDRLIPAISGNEIVLYSIEQDEERSYIKPPYIHFDYERDGNKDSTKPNEYIPIPDSKSYVAGFKAPKCEEEVYIDENGAERKTKHRYRTKVKNHVSVKFKLIEIDSASGAVRHALNGIDELDGIMGEFSTKVPFAGLISPSIGITNVVTSKLLERYSSPDFIMSIDMSFQLADRNRLKQENLPPAKYLKYGYYFFLSEPIDAKLYASVRSPEHVQLMLHQDPEYLKKMKKKRKKADPTLDREYFPLLDANYIVIKVSEPTGASDGRHKYQYLEDAHKLENIFRNARRGDESPSTTRRKIVKLGKSLGVFDSDSDSECGCEKCRNGRDVPQYPYPSPNPWESRMNDPLDPSDTHLSKYHTTNRSLTSEFLSNNVKNSSKSQTVRSQISEIGENAPFSDSSSPGIPISDTSSRERKSFVRRRNRRNKDKTGSSDASAPTSPFSVSSSKCRAGATSVGSVASNREVQKNIDRIIAVSNSSGAGSSKMGNLRVAGIPLNDRLEATPSSPSTPSQKFTSRSHSSASSSSRRRGDAESGERNLFKLSRNRGRKNSTAVTEEGQASKESKADDSIRRSRRRI